MNCEGCFYNKKQDIGIDCAVFKEKIKDYDCYATAEEAKKREDAIKEYTSLKKPQKSAIDP